MEHPNSKCRIAQAEYLNRLPEEEREIRPEILESETPAIFTTNKRFQSKKTD